MGRPGETEEERKIRKEKERKRRKEKERREEKVEKSRSVEKDRKISEEKKSKRRKDETEEERKIRKEKERRERRKNETTEERKIRKEKEAKDAKRDKEGRKSKPKREGSAHRIKSGRRQEDKSGYLAPTRSKSLKESETKYTYEKKIEITNDENQPEFQVHEQDEVNEEYEDDFDDYDDDFEIFEPNEKQTKAKSNKLEKISPELDFDYASLQLAMKKEASNASIQNSERRRAEILERVGASSSTTPDYPSPDIRTVIPRTFRSDWKRAREILKLITLDYSSDVCFKKHHESEYSRFLANVGLSSRQFRCVAVGTDGETDSRAIQTEIIETSDSWSQNVLSSKTKELRTAEVDFRLMKPKNLRQLADITEVLLEEIEYEKYNLAGPKKTVQFRDFVSEDDFEVVLDKNWNYLAIFNSAKLTIVKRETEEILYTQENPEISTLKFDDHNVLIGTTYGAVIRFNLFKKGTISSNCIDNGHSVSIHHIDVLSREQIISIDVLGGIRKMALFESEMEVVQVNDLDEEIYAVSSNETSLFISLFDRITVLSKANIKTPLANIITNYPYNNITVERINSLLIVSNDIQTIFYNMGNYLERMRFEFPAYSIVADGESIFFISDESKIIHFHISQNIQKALGAPVSPTKLFARNHNNRSLLMVQTPNEIYQI